VILSEDFRLVRETFTPSQYIATLVETLDEDATLDVAPFTIDMA